MYVPGLVASQDCLSLEAWIRRIHFAGDTMSIVSSCRDCKGVVIRLMI